MPPSPTRCFYFLRIIFWFLVTNTLGTFCWKGEILVVFGRRVFAFGTNPIRKIQNMRTKKSQGLFKTGIAISQCFALKLNFSRNTTITWLIERWMGVMISFIGFHWTRSLGTNPVMGANHKVYACLFTKQTEKSSLTKLAPVCFKKYLSECSEGRFRFRNSWIQFELETDASDQTIYQTWLLRFVRWIKYRHPSEHGFGRGSK